MTHRITRYTSEEEVAAGLRADVAAGLTADPKWLPPKWFYDARGSVLFEQITTLPEYYPTRRRRRRGARRRPPPRSCSA